ncbi:class I SAM-dependent methyltransferase [Nostoc sp. CENA67]|uniref:Class I SAM-dependent methyltransferase n=1 Tax=Amazonocrinis nigriterrae CENA67 TaxID=2794033 RepID=A0A8J7HVN3_9NOST|nr:class I SAM-dependent methyltransferase [Amazonocrinis nigriterrae]MBH8566848.1 class I SAM-dependent methyltransferase [Amazonocrinis nigriterrae CENA67]
MSEPILEPILRYLRLRRVIRHIPQGSVVLDIGCGNKAAFLKAISPFIKQGFGVDFKVNNYQFDNIQTKQLKLENHLPFADETFQVVTMLAVLEHIDQEKEILQEIYRVLMPGGKLVLTVPSVWSQPILEFLAYKLKIISEAEIRDHKRYYNRSKLKKVLIEVTGFKSFHHEYFQLWMNNFCTVVKKV